MKSLASESDQWKKHAEELLEESKLIRFLSELGDVYFTGSYRYNLMMSGDIDLYILHPQAGKKMTVSIMNALIEENYWNVYFYGDWVNFRAPDMPVGHYLGLKRDFAGSRWKVDIWNTPQVEAEYLDYNEWIEQTLTPNTRETILVIKQANIQYKWDISCITIYNAVLNKEVANLEEFQSRFIDKK